MCTFWCQLTNFFLFISPSQYHFLIIYLFIIYIASICTWIYRICVYQNTIPFFICFKKKKKILIYFSCDFFFFFLLSSFFFLLLIYNIIYIYTYKDNKSIYLSIYIETFDISQLLATLRTSNKQNVARQVGQGAVPFSQCWTRSGFCFEANHFPKHVKHHMGRQ